MLRLGIGSLTAIITFRRFSRPKYPLLTIEQQSFLQAYFDADLIVSAPGNFLYTSGKFGLSFLAAIYSMMYAIWALKPLYILPQSIGPLKRTWERWLIRWILNRARLVLIREKASMAQIQQAKVTNPRIVLQPDMAFSFAAAPSEDAKQWLISYGIDCVRDRPLLGITAINWGAQTGQHAIQAQYESALSDAVRYFVEHTGGKVLFFPQVAGNTASADDRIPARRVIANLQQSGDRVILIDRPPPPAILKAAYELMDIFIGTRMHSNIFALSAGVPVLAIAYRHKTQGIMHMLGLDEWIIDIQDVTGNLLVERLAALWEQKETVRQNINLALPPVLAQSSQAGAMIADDYAQYLKVRC